MKQYKELAASSLYSITNIIKEEAICHQAVDMAYWINLENEVNK